MDVRQRKQDLTSASAPRRIPTLAPGRFRTANSEQRHWARDARRTPKRRRAERRLLRTTNRKKKKSGQNHYGRREHDVLSRRRRAPRQQACREACAAPKARPQAHGAAVQRG